MIVIGIDPGLTGAVAVMDHNGVRAVADLPVMQVPGSSKDAMVQKKIDAYGLCQLLLKHCPAGEGKPMVIIEQVHARSGAGTVQSQGSLMRSLGAIESVLECLRIPVRYVAPQTWKKRFGLKSEKAQSLETARRLHPEAAADLKRAKDHNRAEAVLLAHYGRMEVA